ncbi:outer membrane beta-barrel protein [Paenimyroides ceti]
MQSQIIRVLSTFYRGNPDLDPSFTDAFDLGFMKRWYKLTLNTSVIL